MKTFSFLISLLFTSAFAENVLDYGASGGCYVTEDSTKILILSELDPDWQNNPATLHPNPQYKGCPVGLYSKPELPCAWKNLYKSVVIIETPITAPMLAAAQAGNKITQPFTYYKNNNGEITAWGSYVVLKPAGYKFSNDMMLNQLFQSDDFHTTKPFEQGTGEKAEHIVLTEHMAAFKLTDFTADPVTDTLITINGHGRSDGDKVRVKPNNSILPLPLVEGVNYVITNATFQTFQLSLNGSIVDLSTAGVNASAVHKVVPSMFEGAQVGDIIVNMLHNRGNPSPATIYYGNMMTTQWTE